MHDLPNPKPFVYFVPKKTLSMAAIIKIPPKKTEETYKDLVCTDIDKANIREVVLTIAENGKLDLLLFKQMHLREIGVAIDHVHPLKLLGVVFSDPKLKAGMKDIFEDFGGFKRNAFLDGLIPSLMLQFEKGKLFQFIPDFAKEVSVPEHEIRPFFQSSDWEGLVWHLIGVPRG
jgi:hypothetical protein